MTSQGCMVHKHDMINLFPAEKIDQPYKLLLRTWVKVFKIIPEFRILRLTFHRKSVSLKMLNSTDYYPIGLDKQNFEHRIVNIFLSLSFIICFGCSKNRLIETVLLSSHNICFN